MNFLEEDMLIDKESIKIIGEKFKVSEEEATKIFEEYCSIWDSKEELLEYLNMAGLETIYMDNINEMEREGTIVKLSYGGYLYIN